MSATSGKQGLPRIGSWLKPLLGTIACLGMIAWLVVTWRAIPPTSAFSTLGSVYFAVLAIPVLSTFAIIGLALTLFELQDVQLFRVLFQLIKPVVQLAAIVLYLVSFLAALFLGLSLVLLLVGTLTFLLIAVHILPPLNTPAIIYVVASVTAIVLLLWGSRVIRWLLREWRKQRDFSGMWLDRLMPWIDHERLLQFMEPAFLNMLVYAFMVAATILDILEQLQGQTILAAPGWIAYKEVALFVLVTVIGVDALRDKGAIALQKFRERKPGA